MREIVTMHQPNYLPWIGLFSKISKADCFVVMDILQYTNHGVIHRNKIRTNTGSGYLTIPISKDFWKDKIKDVKLPYNQEWRTAHWKTIYHNYTKTDFFKEHKEFFETLYQENFTYLWQINMEIVRYLIKSFNIDVEIIFSSTLNLDPNLKHTDMIIAVLKKLNAKSYLSGPSGRNYLEFEKLQQNGINLKFVQFNHPIYKQRYPGFESNMSAIDLLFNVGHQSNQIIKSSGNIIPDEVIILETAMKNLHRKNK
jgi:WbqC-like protein family